MDTTYLLGHGELVFGVGGKLCTLMAVRFRGNLVNTEEGRLIRELLKALKTLCSRRLLSDLENRRSVSGNSSKVG